MSELKINYWIKQNKYGNFDVATVVGVLFSVHWDTPAKRLNPCYGLLLNKDESHVMVCC